jgi:hypothetical protein
VTKEGVKAVEDAIAYLAKQSPQPGFTVTNVQGLALAGEDHASDIGGKGMCSHTGSDNADASTRQSRYGQWLEKSGECLWYGKMNAWTDGTNLVDDLIVDDGVASRGHRLCIYDQAFTLAGCFVGSHDVYNNMAALQFAGGFVPSEGKLSMRLTAGPPIITAPAASKIPAPAGKKSRSSTTSNKKVQRRAVVSYGDDMFR